MKGEIGELRIKKTKEVMDKTDLALLVIDGNEKDLSFEKEWYEDLKKRKIPVVGVINKIDKNEVAIRRYSKGINIDFVKVSAKDKLNIDELKKAIMRWHQRILKKVQLLVT